MEVKIIQTTPLGECEVRERHLLVMTNEDKAGIKEEKVPPSPAKIIMLDE